jgi:GTP cyclohydrolase I
MKKTDLKLLEWIAGFVPAQELDRLKSGFEKSPSRITKAYKELFSGYEMPDAGEILTVTEDIPGKDFTGLVSGLDIPFLSFCEHHFLPFVGTADVIYEPDEHILGIGKLSRLVDYRTKRFNIQENIARQICEDLIKFGKVKGAFARVTASHMCLCYRGPQKYQSTNIVTYSTGTCRQTSIKNDIDLILK